MKTEIIDTLQTFSKELREGKISKDEFKLKFDSEIAKIK